MQYLARPSVAVAACCMLLATAVVAQGPANPTRIPGALPDEPTPHGFQPGVAAQVRQQLNYPLVYLLWRNQTIAQTGFGLTLRNSSSLTDVVPNQGSANSAHGGYMLMHAAAASFNQFDNGVTPQTARSFLFITRSRFNNSQVLSQYIAGSNSSNTYDGTATGTRPIAVGSNQATIIARGTLGPATGQQAPSVSFRDGGQRRRLAAARALHLFWYPTLGYSSSTGSTVKSQVLDDQHSGMQLEPGHNVFEQDLRRGVRLKTRSHRLWGSLMSTKPVPTRLQMQATWGGPFVKPLQSIDTAKANLQQLALLIKARSMSSAEAVVGMVGAGETKA